MEAMSSNLTIICFDIRGNTDFIKNGEGGYLCKINSTDNLKSTIYLN